MKIDCVPHIYRQAYDLNNIDTDSKAIARDWVYANMGWVWGSIWSKASIGSMSIWFPCRIWCLWTETDGLNNWITGVNCTILGIQKFNRRGGGVVTLRSLPILVEHHPYLQGFLGARVTLTGQGNPLEGPPPFIKGHASDEQPEWGPNYAWPGVSSVHRSILRLYHTGIFTVLFRRNVKQQDVHIQPNHSQIMLQGMEWLLFSQGAKITVVSLSLYIGGVIPEPVVHHHPFSIRKQSCQASNSIYRYMYIYIYISQYQHTIHHSIACLLMPPLPTAPVVVLISRSLATNFPQASSCSTAAGRWYSKFSAGFWTRSSHSVCYVTSH